VITDQNDLTAVDSAGIVEYMEALKPLKAAKIGVKDMVKQCLWRYLLR
jgi:hypothetical protein